MIREYDATIRSRQPVTVAELFQPVKVHEPGRSHWAAALGLALAIVLGFAVYHFISGTHHAPPAPPWLRSGLAPRLTTAPGTPRGTPVRHRLKHARRVAPPARRPAWLDGAPCLVRWPVSVLGRGRAGRRAAALRDRAASPPRHPDCRAGARSTHGPLRRADAPQGEHALDPGQMLGRLLAAHGPACSAVSSLAASSPAVRETIARTCRPSWPRVTWRCCVTSPSCSGMPPPRPRRGGCWTRSMMRRCPGCARPARDPCFPGQHERGPGRDPAPRTGRVEHRR